MGFFYITYCNYEENPSQGLSEAQRGREFK